MLTNEELISHIRVIPDFPVKGIMFQDITTLLKDSKCLLELSDRLYEQYKDKGITKVVGVESRGYILGACLALRLGVGFITARKAGKLPAAVISESYAKEYGKDAIEIHADALSPDDVVVIHDDLLATGGTTTAAYRLVKKFGVKDIHLSFLINLTDCPRIPEFPADAPLSSILDIIEHK